MYRGGNKRIWWLIKQLAAIINETSYKAIKPITHSPNTEHKHRIDYYSRLCSCYSNIKVSNNLETQTTVNIEGWKSTIASELYCIYSCVGGKFCLALWGRASILEFWCWGQVLVSGLAANLCCCLSLPGIDMLQVFPYGNICLEWVGVWEVP